LIPDPELSAADVDYIFKRFLKIDLAELAKYVISALECNPNTLGVLIIGISLI
jgi:hypothetical protein